MKQVLLRVTAVFAKIRFGKLTQPLRCDFLSTRSQIGWQCDRFATYRAASRTGRTLSLATLGGDACARAAELGGRFQKNVFHRAGD